MTVANIIVTILLAALLTIAAARKLAHTERVVESYRRAGVPEDKLNYLAAILLVGAAGLVFGLVWPPIGVAAAIGVTGYFTGAMVSHVRADDAGRIPTPSAYAALAVAVLALRLTTL